jgi:hypothetical protein
MIAYLLLGKYPNLKAGLGYLPDVSTGFLALPIAFLTTHSRTGFSTSHIPLFSVRNLLDLNQFFMS